MATDINSRMRQKQYESAVFEFATEKKGYFLVASDDPQFSSLLRQTLTKQLAIPGDMLSTVSNPDHILREIKGVLLRRKSLLLFLERILEGRDTNLLVRQLKSAYPDLKIIIITGETERHRLVLLHEVGADNFITKPISINTLIEKMAFTIKPFGKLGQLIDQAREMLQQGLLDPCLKVCRQILELKPGSAAGYLIMGEAYQVLGKMEKARSCFEEASRNADLYLEPLRKLADLHRDQGEKEEQLRCLERLDELSPLNVERKVDMGALHLEMGNEERAEDLFDRAVTQATREAMNYISDISGRIATIYSTRDPQKAEQFLRRALDAKGDMIDYSDLETFNRLGIALRRQGKWQEALTEYSKALTVAPSDENLFYNMGMACAEGRDFRQARNHMLKALSLNPNLPRRDPVMAYNTGLIFMRAGGKEQAEYCLKMALELDPSFARARYALEKLGTTEE